MSDKREDDESSFEESSDDEDLGFEASQLRRGTFVGTINYLSPEMA